VIRWINKDDPLDELKEFARAVWLRAKLL